MKIQKYEIHKLIKKLYHWEYRERDGERKREREVREKIAAENDFSRKSKKKKQLRLFLALYTRIQISLFLNGTEKKTFVRPSTMTPLSSISAAPMEFMKSRRQYKYK